MWERSRTGELCNDAAEGVSSMIERTRQSHRDPQKEMVWTEPQNIFFYRGPQFVATHKYGQGLI